MGIQCDQPPPPAPPGEVVAKLEARPLGVGTSFRATLEAESVMPRFLSKQKARRTGQIRAVDARVTVTTSFQAELLALEPERWRIDFEAFSRATQTAGAEEATSTYDLPGNAFIAEFGEPAVVTDAEGGDVTDSQHEYTLAVADVLRERHDWAEYIASREFGQGKIVQGSKGLVLGRFAQALFGPISDPHTTVALFRFDEDAAKNEVAHFEVHSRFKAHSPEGTDGSYFDFEAKGSNALRVNDALLIAYSVAAKVTPRAATGAMLPEGSGSWRAKFEIDATTLKHR